MPSRRSSLPAFALYGEAEQAAPSLHVESIATRSELYEWEIHSHVHRGLHQILWLNAGPVDALLDETRTQAEGPLAIVIPPAVAHAFRFSPDTDGVVMTLDARRIVEGGDTQLGDALAALFEAPRVLKLPEHAAQRLGPLMAALHREASLNDHSPVPAWLARCAIWLLAQEARRERSGPPREAGRDALYTRWVVLMEAHYRDHWPVSRYAQRLGLSEERLNRLVRTETGRNAQALLHERLLREACRRLVHVAAPVSQIGFELGFDDPAYFSRFVRRHTGLGPRAYRERALGAAG